jgi:hypothetical protein
MSPDRFSFDSNAEHFFFLPGAHNPHVCQSQMLFEGSSVKNVSRQFRTAFIKSRDTNFITQCSYALPPGCMAVEFGSDPEYLVPEQRNGPFSRSCNIVHAGS